MLSYSAILHCPNLDSRRSKGQLKTVTNGKRKRYRQKNKVNKYIDGQYSEYEVYADASKTVDN